VAAGISAHLLYFRVVPGADEMPEGGSLMQACAEYSKSA